MKSKHCVEGMKLKKECKKKRASVTNERITNLEFPSALFVKLKVSAEIKTTPGSCEHRSVVRHNTGDDDRYRYCCFEAQGVINIPDLGREEAINSKWAPSKKSKFHRTTFAVTSSPHELKSYDAIIDFLHKVSYTIIHTVCVSYTHASHVGAQFLPKHQQLNLLKPFSCGRSKVLLTTYMYRMISFFYSARTIIIHVAPNKLIAKCLEKRLNGRLVVILKLEFLLSKRRYCK